MTTLFIPNTDFDFTLRHEEISPKIRRGVDEMATLFLPALPTSHTILSRLSVDPSYETYLASKELSTATLSSALNGGESYDAWGWLEQVKTDVHPNRRIIEKVNSRQFSYDLQARLATALPASTKLTFGDTLPPWVDTGCEWVAKPLFGNAGAGFLQGVGPQALEESLRANPSESYICEPWLERITDIATRSIVTKSGEVIIAGHHRNISNRAGSFYANLCADNDPEITPWRHSLDRQAKIIGKELFKAGYWGVVGIDSFTYEGEHGTELAGGFDINARHTISTLSYGIKEKLEHPASFMYRFIAKRRLALPESYDELEKLLGEIAYTPQKREGIILLSPLAIINKGQSNPPLRSAFGIVANSIERTFQLDELLRIKVLKRK